jgi:glycosyltransferase involved in cell wall biosynthesis
VQKISTEQIGSVCFWNLDPKIKLLVSKALAFTRLRLIDVSPGSYSFEEMEEITRFGQLVCFSPDEFYQRLNTLVLKFNGLCPTGCEDKTIIIPNGVPRARRIKTDYSIRGAARIVVNGRIASTKFIKEIILSMQIVWMHNPLAQLHLFGGAEPLHQEYAQEVLQSASSEVDKRIFFHGTNFEAISQLAQFDAYVVLGKHQGCPNALLEALSVGLPVVANDDGGTREQVIDGKTGLLIPDCSPAEIATALLRILSDRTLAKKLGEAGREHVTRSFSMEAMVAGYTQLFDELSPVKKSYWEELRSRFSKLASFTWLDKYKSGKKSELVDRIGVSPA